MPALNHNGCLQTRPWNLPLVTFPLPGRSAFNCPFYAFIRDHAIEIITQTIAIQLGIEMFIHP